MKQVEKYQTSNENHTLYEYYVEDSGFDRSRESTIGIATGYELDGRRVEVLVPVGTSFFSSPHHPDRFWSLPSIIFNWYRRLVEAGIKSHGGRFEHLLQTCYFSYNTRIKCFRTHVDMAFFSCFATGNSCPKFVRTFQLRPVHNNTRWSA
jgi:hypothetical protein